MPNAFRHSSCLRTTLQKDKIRREKTKTNKKQEFFQKHQRHSQRMVERYKVFEQVRNECEQSKCTNYTSVTWIIIVSHPNEITVTRVGTCSRASSAIYYIFGRMRRPTPTAFSVLRRLTRAVFSFFSSVGCGSDMIAKDICETFFRNFPCPMPWVGKGKIERNDFCASLAIGSWLAMSRIHPDGGWEKSISWLWMVKKSFLWR